MNAGMVRFLKYLALVFIAIGMAAGYAWWNYDAIVAAILHPQTNAASASDDSFSLVTADGRHFALSEIDAAIASFSAADVQQKPLVLYVHGFGPDPDGDFGLYTMGELAKGAGADVIMFRWPSWISVTEFPVLNAKAASERLIALMQQTAERQAPGGTLAGRPLVIVAHSLAGEVFRHVGEADAALPKGLAARILFAVPETGLPGHRAWMEKLTFADEIFVFINKDDPALQVATTMFGEARLGRSLENLDGSAEPLAGNADYIVLDPESWRHYFFVSGQRNEAIDEVFGEILRRGSAALSNRYLHREPAGNVYTVTGPGTERPEG